MRALPIVVALTLLAQFSQAAHYALVEHTICSEHGELIHGHSQRHHAAVFETLVLGMFAQQQTADVVADTIDADAHDHCQTFTREQLATLPARVDDVCIARLETTAHVTPTQHVIASRDPLAVAPKASPPRV